MNDNEPTRINTVFFTGERLFEISNELDSAVNNIIARNNLSASVIVGLLEMIKYRVQQQTDGGE